MAKCIILAAWKGTRLLPYTLDLPKPMISVNWIPAIKRQIEMMKSYGVHHFVIVVSYKKEKLISFCEQEFKHSWIKIDFVEPIWIIGTAISALSAKEVILNKNKNEDLFVLDWDTLWDEELKMENIQNIDILFWINKIKIPYSIISDNKLIEKPTFECNIWIRYFKNASKFFDAIEKYNKIKIEEWIEPSVNEAINFYNDENYILKTIEVNSYKDIWSLENYKKTCEYFFEKEKSDLFKTRFFNDFINDWNSVMKISIEKQQKLIDEINWFLYVQKKYIHLIPEIKEYSIQKDRAPFLKMKIYPYNLYNYFLHENITKKEMQDICKKLITNIQNLNNLTDKESYNWKNIQENILIWLEWKWKERFDDFTNIDLISKKELKIYDEFIKTNLQSFHNITFDVNFIHWDLHSWNILLDNDLNPIFIDPRWSFWLNFGFSEFTIAYDIAKIKHDFLGYNDIINSKENVKLHEFYEILYEKLKKTFCKTLQDEKFIDFLTIYLFITLIPFHKDNKQNITKFKEIIDNEILKFNN